MTDKTIPEPRSACDCEPGIYANDCPVHGRAAPPPKEDQSAKLARAMAVVKFAIAAVRDHRLINEPELTELFGALVLNGFLTPSGERVK